MNYTHTNPHHKCSTRLFAVLLLMAIWLFAPGCVTYEKCLDKYGTIGTDSATVTATVLSPADSATGTVNCDTLRVGYPVYFYSTDTVRIGSKAATVKLEKQADGSVKATADCPPVPVQAQVKCPPVNSFAPKCPPCEHFPWYLWVGIGLVSGLGIALILKR